MKSTQSYIYVKSTQSYIYIYIYIYIMTLVCGLQWAYSDMSCQWDSVLSVDVKMNSITFNKVGRSIVNMKLADSL